MVLSCAASSWPGALSRRCTVSRHSAVKVMTSLLACSDCNTRALATRRSLHILRHPLLPAASVAGTKALRRLLSTVISARMLSPQHSTYLNSSDEDTCRSGASKLMRAAQYTNTSARY